MWGSGKSIGPNVAGGNTSRRSIRPSRKSSRFVKKTNVSRITFEIEPTWMRDAKMVPNKIDVCLKFKQRRRCLARPLEGETIVSCFAFGLNVLGVRCVFYFRILQSRACFVQWLKQLKHRRYFKIVLTTRVCKPSFKWGATRHRHALTRIDFDQHGWFMAAKCFTLWDKPLRIVYLEYFFLYQASGCSSDCVGMHSPFTEISVARAR